MLEKYGRHLIFIPFQKLPEMSPPDIHYLNRQNIEYLCHIWAGVSQSFLPSLPCYRSKAFTRPNERWIPFHLTISDPQTQCWKLHYWYFQEKYSDGMHTLFSLDQNFRTKTRHDMYREVRRRVSTLERSIISDNIQFVCR